MIFFAQRRVDALRFTSMFCWNLVLIDQVIQISSLFWFIILYHWDVLLVLSKWIISPLYE